MSEQSKIHVAVLTDDQLIREGLQVLVTSTPDFEFVEGWADAETALNALQEARPDVLLLDVKLPQGAAFNVLKALPQVSHTTRALVTVECREEGCYVLSPGVLGGIFRARSTAAEWLDVPKKLLQPPFDM